MIGQTISHYKILEKLGEGGMGVVYKAHDTKLDRLVALKFLPHHLTANDAEKARLLQEAIAASALNHPNVCTIYDIKEEHGQQFIVMEYIDGKTLRQVLPIQKLTDALAYAIQIGEALQEAHEKGIVHRDIKADNIMVNSKNQVKVMDFGLAKLKGSLKLTRTSSTVGTLAYMSPEQIQGSDVDTRSDIFSFGVLLFEVLTGHLPFRGEHEAAMMYSIINEQPESFQKYSPDASPELLHIFSSALEKNPEDRYQAISEMVRDLRRLQKQSTKVSRQSLAETPAMTRNEQAMETSQSGHSVASGGKRKKTIWIAGGVLVAVAIIAVFVLLTKRGVELNPDMKFRTLQIPFTQIGYPGLSPDGNWIAFPAADANGKWDLYFMNTAGGDPRQITYDSSLSISIVDVSPDGSEIIFDRITKVTGVNEICIVSSLGGKSKVLADSAGEARWSPDGRRFGYIRMGASQKKEYWSMQPDGGNRRLEFDDSIGGTQGRISFAYSQQSSSITFLRTFPERGNEEIIIRDLATGKERQITNDQKNIDEVCWTPNNQIIFSSNRGGNSNLWMVPASGGDAVQITKGSGPDLGIKISADGKKLLYYQRQETSRLWIGNIEHGTTSQALSVDWSISMPALSPDGKYLAFGMSGSDPLHVTPHLYVSDRDGSNRQQLTFNDEHVGNPLWSPDGKWIVYAVWPEKEDVYSAKLYLIDPSNPRAPKPMGDGFPDKWIDDTTFIAERGLNLRISVYGVNGVPPKQFYVDSVAVLDMSDKSFTFIDFRKGKEENWFVPHNIMTTIGHPEIIQSSAARYDKYPKDLRFVLRSQDGVQRLYLNEKTGEFSVMTFPAGTTEIIKGKFQSLKPGNESRVGSFGYDRKEIVYTDQLVSGKLVMIENLFK